MKRGSDDVWQEALAGFRSYLKLEKSLSPNTLAAYSRDVAGLFDFLRENGGPTPLDAKTSDLEAFVAARVSVDKLAKRSHARLLSSIKSFYGFLD